VGVDHRPELERRAVRALRRCVLLILGCAAFGGGVAAATVLYLTTPKEAPC
jgi:hypothetical protein